MKKTWLKIFSGLFVCCWLLVTFAALAGMYHLWWQRERVLYLGKTVQEQRQTVFQRAGFPVSFVEKTRQLKQQWQPTVHYTAQGDITTSLSYIKYLLLPRVPSGSLSHVLTVRGETWSAVGGLDVPFGREAVVAKTNNAFGLFSSLFFLTGLGFLWRKFFGRTFTWPESFGVSCLFLTLIVLPIRFVFYSADSAFIIAMGAGLSGWFLFLFERMKRVSVERNFVVSSGVPTSKSNRYFLGILVVLIISAALWSMMMSVVVVPDDWDAWAIWGSKAKVLALGTGPLHDVTWFGHADYPLLWPVVWAFSGWISGGWEECWSKGWGAIFLVLCVWEIICIVRYQTKSVLAGVFAGALFISMPNVPLIASWGYAEAPLWLMMTCGLACFLRWTDTGKARAIVLAGVFAAAAAYTKNEGMLFALLLGCLSIFSPQKRLRSLLYYSMTFACCYFLWFYWARVYVDLGSHATVGLHFDGESLQRALHRLPAALDAIGHMWRDVRQWNVVGGVLVLAVLGAPLLWRRERIQLLYLLLPLGLLSGYLVIVLLHSAEIYWQVGTAWNRLTVQTLPLFIVLLVPLYYGRITGYKP